jgi:hypothetical protein
VPNWYFKLNRLRSQIATALGKQFMGNQIATITSVIRTVRGQKVLLDEDLARIYEVPRPTGYVAPDGV